MFYYFPGVADCDVGLLLLPHPLIDWGNRQTGTMWLMCVRTSFSRHIMPTGVSPTGLKLCRVDVSGLLGTGMMVEDLEIQRTTAWDSDSLKMSAYTPASCSPQAFRTLAGTPRALWGFIFLRAFRTCVSHVEGSVRVGSIVFDALHYYTIYALQFSGQVKQP